MAVTSTQYVVSLQVVSKILVKSDNKSLFCFFFIKKACDLIYLGKKIIYEWISTNFFVLSEIYRSTFEAVVSSTFSLRNFDNS